MSEDRSQSSKQDQEDLSKMSFQFGKRNKQNHGSSTPRLTVNSLPHQESKISQNEGQKEPVMPEAMPEANIESNKTLPFEEEIQRPKIVQMSMPAQISRNPQSPKVEIQITYPIKRIRRSSFFEEDPLYDERYHSSQLTEQASEEKIEKNDQILQSQKKIRETHNSHGSVGIVHRQRGKQESRPQKETINELKNFGEKKAKYSSSKLRIEDMKDEDLKLADDLGLWKQDSRSPSKESFSRQPVAYSRQKMYQTEVNYQPQQKEESRSISEIYEEEKVEKELEKKAFPKRQVNCFNRGKNHQVNDYDQIKCYDCKKNGHIAKYCPQPRKCHQCGSIDHLARDCPSNYSYRQNNWCYNCHQRGHFAKECTIKPFRCFLCHQVGHQVQYCPKNKQKNPKKQAERMLKPRKCYNCQQEGHYAPECPKPRCCYACGQEGHFSNDCPHAKRRPNPFDASHHEPEKVEKKQSVEKAKSEPDVRNQKPCLKSIYKNKNKSLRKTESAKKKQSVKKEQQKKQGNLKKPKEQKDSQSD